MDSEEGIEPYTLLDSGEIPADVQKIESIGEAYHDFIIDTSRSSVLLRMKMKEFFQRIEGITRGISEEDTSILIHDRFNGGESVRRADLRLDVCKRDKPYEDPRVLADALFFSPDRAGRDILEDDKVSFQVKPLVFMIPTYLLERGEFDPLLSKLADILQRKYQLVPIVSSGLAKLGVTHDAYTAHGKIENIFGGHVMLSPATLYDPASTGIDDITSAMREGRFHMNLDISGTSYWGTWRMQQNALGNSSSITLNIDGHPITLDIPVKLYRGPSPANLSMIYDTLMNYLTDGRINILDSNKNLLLGEIFSKNPGKGAYDRGFYTTIINEYIRLYNINPDLVLKFIFFLKELGDMMQHYVAVRNKHLALGSCDGLSTIAFLKRGGPVSYMVKLVKGLPNLLFRVAGTLHKGEGMTEEEIAEQARQVAAAAARAAAAKEALKREKAILRREARAAEAEDDKVTYSKFETAKRYAAAESLRRAARAARASAKRIQSTFILRFRLNRDTGKWAVVLPGGAGFLSPLGTAPSISAPGITSPTISGTKRNRDSVLRKRKQTGGKWNKTFKQKGGTYQEIDGTVILLINALFMNLYYVLDNDDVDTILFTNPHPYTNEFVYDYSLIGKFSDKGQVFFDNTILGLPLSSVLYMLSDVIDEADNKDEIIKQFLEVYNFTDADVNRILHYMQRENLSDTDITRILEIVNADSYADLEPMPEISRRLTLSDKDQLRNLVDKGYDIPGIIPTVYYEVRINKDERIRREAEYIDGIRAGNPNEYMHTEFELAVTQGEVKALEEMASDKLTATQVAQTLVAKAAILAGKHKNRLHKVGPPYTVPLQTPPREPARAFTRKQRKSRSNTTWKRKGRK